MSRLKQGCCHCDCLVQISIGRAHVSDGNIWPAESMRGEVVTSAHVPLVREASRACEQKEQAAATLEEGSSHNNTAAAAGRRWRAFSLQRGI